MAAHKIRSDIPEFSEKGAILRISIHSKTAKTIFALAIAATALALGTNSASAHAFGQRYDLPIPLGYFLIGAVATVALSFVVMGMFVRKRGDEAAAYPRYNLLRAPVVGAAMGGRVLYGVVGALSAAALGLLLVVGFFGTDRAVENLSPTFIWIIWWVGMGYAAALFGNLWAYLNPWKVVYEWIRKIGGGAAKGENPPFAYPEWLDAWPAVALFFVFAWAENVFTGAFRPFTLSVLVLAYSIITWAGMALFGKNIWLRNGEAFSVLFGLFSRFSVTETRATNRAVCRDCGSGCADESDCVDCHACFERAGRDGRELNLRPPAVGLLTRKRISTATAAFVILALATVTFDGFQDTEVWTDFRTSLARSAGVDVVDTLGLAAAPLAFAALYAAFCFGVKLASGERGGAWTVARAFVFSLVPIALAYHLAHFLTLLLIEGQLIIPLLSDPFGFGWDMFGTAGYVINTDIIGARTVWFVSLAAIGGGHAASVYLAHATALRRAPPETNAAAGQLPMLGLMLLYTASSLWIIAQPLTA